MTGTCDPTNKLYLINCIKLNKNANYLLVPSLINNSMVELGFLYINLAGLVSDCASYMHKSIDVIKQIHTLNLPVKCFAHLLYNWAMEIRQRHMHVDNLIASVRGNAHKNRKIVIRFESIGVARDAIVTGRLSWLKEGLYFVQICQ